MDTATATITAEAVENVIRDILAMQTAAQNQMDWLVNQDPAAVNTPGTSDHRMYHQARVERDTYAAPLMALQALVNTAHRD